VTSKGRFTFADNSASAKLKALLREGRRAHRYGVYGRELRHSLRRCALLPHNAEACHLSIDFACRMMT
jgi:hypothetical protein